MTESDGKDDAWYVEQSMALGIIVTPIGYIAHTWFSFYT